VTVSVFSDWLSSCRYLRGAAARHAPSADRARSPVDLAETFLDVYRRDNSTRYRSYHRSSLLDLLSLLQKGRRQWRKTAAGK